MGDYGDVYEYEVCFGGGGVEFVFECVDEVEVGVGEVRGGVGEVVVVEGVGVGVFYEGFEVCFFCGRRVSNSDKREGGLGVLYNLV